MKRRRKLIGALIVLAVAAAVWFGFNPPGRFGWCRYALTTYGGIPRPVADLQIRPDGTQRSVTKTHDLTFDAIQWLLDAKPDVLIIAIGWDGLVEPDEKIRQWKGAELHILKNREAIELYNRLKHESRKVAIHYHSTC